jgi:hypothetical protein
MKTIIRAVLFSLIVIAVFSTCDTSPGMGDSIDWEAPVLKMDPVPNPLYVGRNGAVITGTVTDNTGVDKVIFIDTATGKELFPVVRLNNDRWIIDLLFTEEQNNQKIVGQVIAYDRMGNSNDNSCAFVTLIVDIKPPLIEYIDIKRTDSRMAGLSKLSELQLLEGTDRKEDLYKYQNGWFYINGIASDKETKVQIISLEFRDSNHRETTLLSLNIDAGYTPYFPRWTVKEEDIINAGENLFGNAYKSKYYDNKDRYYYRVIIKAQDASDNTNDIIVEDEGYICLWADSDKPKGLVDPTVGTEVSKGTPFPVDFYDDDSIIWAYAGLLTLDQWLGINEVASGVRLPGGPTFEDENAKMIKLRWLKERLTGRDGDDVTPGGTPKGPVYNWNFDKNATPLADSDKITDQIKGSSVDEKLVYVQTSNRETDCGDYVLFTLIADKKLSPHTGNGPEFTNRNGWEGKAVLVRVKDENAPLIVFDTTAGCPEENTFPETLISGEYFNIVGYTLRENGGGGDNKVTEFRMAWIPYNMPDGPDRYITVVQNALKNNSDYPDGVQYWEFKENAMPGSGFGNFIDDKNVDDQGIVTGDPKKDVYRRQRFSKQFSVMGSPDEIKPAYNSFNYDYKLADGKPGQDGVTDLENETKLFIFYAIDNMGHEVFRQLRLLGLNDKPVLHVYDITNRVTTLPATPAVATDIPNPTANGNTKESTGEPTEKYYNELNAYNGYTPVKTALNTSLGGLPDTSKQAFEAQSFKIYPRGTTVKYTVEAPQKNNIPIRSITMKDITFALNDSGQVIIGSGYDSAAKTFSFCEYYPDVTQRTFLFEATDMLGNVTAIQRTIAVSNAAQLESITTTSQNGTYGHGDGVTPTIITLSANFSSQIYLSDGGARPEINVRYQLSGSAEYNYLAIPCKNSPTVINPSINLEFDFNVPLNAAGVLETVYSGIPGTPSPAAGKDRPLNNGESIMDLTREGSAFIPGYNSGSVTMPNWEEKDKPKTLQGQKTISLDGVHPIMGTPGWGGKTAYKDAANVTYPNNFYFKKDETVEVTIPATNKAIRTSGNSILQYRIREANGTLRPSNSTYYGTSGTTNGLFKYLRPGTEVANSLVYSLTINATSCPYDGEIIDVSLYTTGSNIVDNFGNTITGSPASLLPSTTRVFVKQLLPLAPAATFNGVLFTAASTPANTNFNAAKNLVIPASTSTAYNTPSVSPNNNWEDTIEYLDPDTRGWLPYTFGSGGKSIGTNGSYTLQARYKDRAGNEGPAATKAIVMNTNFPNLVSVNATEPNRTYLANSSLTFNLNFASKVTITTPANVKITLENRGAGNKSENIMELNNTTSTITLTNSGSTVSFRWANITGKEMREGVYISSITITGLSDDYGNIGSTATGNYSGDNGTFTGDSTVSGSKNMAKGLIIDAIPPSIDTAKLYDGRDPKHNNTPTGNTLVKEIKIAFTEPVMKGSGIITIKPKGNGYAIPPVLEDTGYYLGYTSNGQISGGTEGEAELFPTKFGSAGNAGIRTYISSFYDIYNNGSLTAADRQKLTQTKTNNNMSDLTLSDRTGQSVGPYKKMTQGLISGLGYSGNYSGSNAPDIGGSSSYTAMIPDTATKWVLDYKYGITQNVTAVNDIRAVLTKAKWRWQEIDVVNTNIDGTGTIVTIPLSEPLLKGLDWEVSYDAGTFTDKAGNKAPAANGSATSDTSMNYYFTSPGVQAPVVRVNRRSSDSRTSDWVNKKTYDNVTDSSGWNSIDKEIADNEGWGPGNFKYIHYRVESESPGAAISAYTFKGAPADKGAAKGAWSGSVADTNDKVTPINDMNWNDGATDTTGSWVLSNIIRRSRATVSQTTFPGTYTVITKSGSPEVRQSPGVILRMFKSYNRDLTSTLLSYPTPVNTNAGLTFATLSENAATKGQGFLEFSDFEAGKCYVVGSATRNGVTNKGVEGVFRTVIMFNYGSSRGIQFIAVEGSNIKNGMPSVAGFPVRDADETDCRYFKAFFNATAGETNARTQFYWVSTEIVCEWYFISWGGGRADTTGANGTHMSSGEASNYMIVGYGDLTYGFNIRMSYDTAVNN